MKNISSPNSPPFSLQPEFHEQQGLQTSVIVVEQVYPPEAAYHEEDNFGISH